MKRHKKLIALCLTAAFLTLLTVQAQPLPAQDQAEDTVRRVEQSRNFFEKERQVGYTTSPRNVLPVLLGIAAVAAGVFLLVMLVSKDKYDIVGEWDFHNDFTTAGHADFDSVWTFVATDDRYKQFGSYVRDENGTKTQGRYTIMEKMEVVFQDDWMTEQYVGRFDSKTTMSGTFVLLDGAEGTWTAKKR